MRTKFLVKSKQFKFFFKKHPLLLVLFLTVIQFAYSHGTVTYPPSRVWNCYLESPESPDSQACMDAVASHGTQPIYDWNGINQAFVDGDHMNFVLDGNLPSGGTPSKYGGMDQVRSDWVATAVAPGPFTVTWTNSAPHATAYYQVYITNEDWNPNQPLTWDSLTLLVQTYPSSAASSVDIPVTLPQRTGKHVIYSIWQRSDSPEAFYSASDVDFSVLSTDLNDFEVEGGFNLKVLYQNPINKTPNIYYKLRKDALVSLKVYDVFGREVLTLINDVQSSGEYEIPFNGENLSNGIYFCVLFADSYKELSQVIIQ